MYRNDLKGKKAGDLRSRFKLKQKLKCKSFRWYLDNIFKGNKFIYDQKVLAFGTVMNAASVSSVFFLSNLSNLTIFLTCSTFLLSSSSAKIIKNLCLDILVS